MHIKPDGKQKAKAAITKWAVASRVAAGLAERLDEANALARRLGDMLDEANEAAANDEAEAAAALDEWGGRLVIENTLATVDEGEELGETVRRVHMEPMGEYGVKRLNGRSA